MFYHFFKYQFKTLLRNKMVIFWTLVFPLALATFFNLAFANLTASEEFETVKVALVEEQANSQFKETLQELEKGDDKLIDLQITSLDKAQQLLKDEKITGYYVVSNEIKLVVNNTGIDETILESIVNEYNSTMSTVENIATLNPSALQSNILNTVNLSKNNFENQNIGGNTDLTVVYFYTLIGMNCLNASFCGLRTTSQIEANLSRQGTRITISPISKLVTVLSGILSAFIIQFAIMMVLMAYLIFGLGVGFGEQTGYIILLIAIGCFTGVGLGNFAGNVLKFKKEDTKISFLSSFSLVLSFFSGMMIIDIKYWMQTNLPILTYINPVSLITDGLYALYYYDNLSRYTTNMICLFVIGVLLILGSLFFTRRKQYDSI
ncbi:ABC transporter permease [Thomasclavelia ramosa]|nr:ABC transporter permease [Thomasclavelia ramosa]MBS6663739.1 ABC transporter permease [Coprobacillus sp.]MBU9076874.1 ABC transporter permease [Erysipelatoclostridium sp. MSK.7.34]MBU9877003.1 ABC transporter permease [Thomasclavelia ramosa]MBU9905859.1 ABC transporter permease [Thomasclavelia ramosa]MBV4084847.1 ABC transporter permease [Thomasclavelia ramosa]